MQNWDMVDVLAEIFSYLTYILRQIPTTRSTAQNTVIKKSTFRASFGLSGQTLGVQAGDNMSPSGAKGYIGSIALRLSIIKN